MKLYPTALLAFSLIFLSCNNKKDKRDDNIQYDSKVFHVKKAYLSVNGKDPVPADFRAEINQNVYLQIEVDPKDWTIEEERIYPGVYEKVESDDKKHVFVQEDMMKDYEGGIAASDGWLITVMAVVRDVDKHYDHFTVNFRVWDKRGKGEITGMYNLYLK